MFSQTEKTGYAEENKKKNAAELTLARKNSDGDIEEDIEIFNPSDVPIICYVDLVSDKPVTVKLNFVAVKVKGVRPNSRVISISYKTKNGENIVTFTGKPERHWVLGNYRVDIFLGGKLATSKEFTVSKKKH